MYPVEYIQLVFERAGFQLLDQRINSDSLNRNGIEWAILLFRLDTNTQLRPLDQIEGILNRDRKTATYKLALFRALCDVSTNSFHSTIWNTNATVSIPIHLITERWLYYYWRIFESTKYIPQHNGESKTKDMVAFRKPFHQLIHLYKQSGGYSSFVFDLTKNISHGNVQTGEMISILIQEEFQERDVYDAKKVYDNLSNKNCIWTGNLIKDKYAIDHVIPYSLWFNNDLWNLLPSLEKVNSQKSDKLPTNSLIQKRKDQIIYYW